MEHVLKGKGREIGFGGHRNPATPRERPEARGALPPSAELHLLLGGAHNAAANRACQESCALSRQPREQALSWGRID